MNENITLFSTIYKAFLNKITEDTYAYYTVEEINQDAEPMLMTAIINFEYPKVNLRDFNLDYDDSDNHSYGCFNNVLTYDEIDILSTLMVIEWSKRKLADSSLLNLIYTGSDAKSLGTKSQIEAIKSQLDYYERDIKRAKNKYALRQVNEDLTTEVTEIGLAGTGVSTSLTSRRRYGRIR